MTTSRLDRLGAALMGRYEIERELGEGGGATVYLARDLKHRRDVALKVLKPDLAAMVGAARFLAEIETTANLRHPHILPLFDSGEADGFVYYVMPYAEGETLRNRIDRERQLPVEEAVRIATAVARALQHAHDKGVVHRDIKPANILLQDGQPVVADFGVALAIRSGGVARLTETGLSVGTPYYMSPEQATGDQAVGPPTDIWALGCVLYEMLTGDPPHVASTPQGVLGRIIQGSRIPVTEVRPSVPPNVDAAIRRALEKIPADRFVDAEDLARALADPGFRHGSIGTTTVPARPRRAIAGLATLAAAMTGLAIWGWIGTSPEPTSAPVSRLTATLPQDHRLSVPQYNAFPIAVSPDGRAIAYVGEASAGTLLYVRNLGSFEPVALAGTQGATQPFFSPDGGWLAYFGNGRLHRVRVSGGAPIPVANVEGVAFGGAWGPDDLIVFAADSSLWRVGIDGGDPERVPLSAPGLVSWPSVLPASAGGWESPSVLVSVGSELYAVSVMDGDARSLGISADGHGFYVDGFVVYAEQSGVVRAAPFDIDALSTSGTSISVLEDVLRPNLTDATVVTASPSGTLAYVPGSSQRRLVLVDRAGRETQLPFQPGAYRGLAVSPDGLRVLVDRRGENLRLLELESGRDSPTAGNTRGIWSPSGQELLMSGGRGGLIRSSAAPGAQPTRVADGGLFPAHWGNDGVVLLFSLNFRADNRGAFHVMRLDEGAPPEPFIDTEAFEHLITRSPDGRWIAYTSDLSGTMEVYVREFAGGEPRQVSVNGGDHAVFSTSSDELYYMSGEQMNSVRTERLGRAGPLDPELLFRGSYVMLGPSWDVRPQGDFVMVSAGPRWLREIQVVQNWVSELEQLFEESER
jgi:serine/threonine-protein kinase